MEIHFKSAHTKDVEDEVTPEVVSLSQRKLVSLKKYLGADAETAQVYVEFGRATEAHQTGTVWRTQINLDVNGKRYHSDAVGETILMASDIAINEIEAELRRVKQRNVSMLRKGGGALKSIMRGFSSE